MSDKMVLMPWGEGLFPDGHDSKFDDFVDGRYDMVEVMVHIDNAGPAAGAEFFTMENKAKASVRNVVREAGWMGMKVLLCLDWHYGNGLNVSCSPVGAGRYHYSSAEGGYGEGLTRLVSWAKHEPNVWGLKIGNEQSAPDDWYQNAVARAAKAIPSHWRLVVGGKNKLAGVQAGANVIDIHPLRSNWRTEYDQAKDLSNRYGCSIAATEMAAPLDISGHTDRMLEYKSMMLRFDQDRAVEVVSLFAGGPSFPWNNGFVKWNFRQHRNFLAWNERGMTGEAGYFGKAFPVKPSQPIPTPEVPPLSEAERERIQRIHDRLKEDYDGGNSQMLRRQVGRELPRLEQIAKRGCNDA